MTAGRPSKYQDRATVCISLERKLKTISQHFGIDFSRALTQGIQFLIDYRIKSGEKIDPVLLSEWHDVKETALAELREYLKIEEDKQIVLTSILEDRQVSDARLDEKIEVWDEDREKYVTIKRRQFNPALHTIKGKP